MTGNAQYVSPPANEGGTASGGGSKTVPSLVGKVGLKQNVELHETQSVLGGSRIEKLVIQSVPLCCSETRLLHARQNFPSIPETRRSAPFTP